MPGRTARPKGLPPTRRSARLKDLRDRAITDIENHLEHTHLEEMADEQGGRSLPIRSSAIVQHHGSLKPHGKGDNMPTCLNVLHHSFASSCMCLSMASRDFFTSPKRARGPPVVVVGYLLAVPAEDSNDWKTSMVRLKTKSGADIKRQLKDIGLYCTGLNFTGSGTIDNTQNRNEVPMGKDWDSTQDTEEQDEGEARELVTQEEAWEQSENNEDLNELLVAPQGTYAEFCAQPSSTYQRSIYDIQDLPA